MCSSEFSKAVFPVVERLLHREWRGFRGLRAGLDSRTKELFSIPIPVDVRARGRTHHWTSCNLFRWRLCNWTRYPICFRYINFSDNEPILVNTDKNKIFTLMWVQLCLLELILSGRSLAEATNVTAGLISDNWTDVLTQSVFLELLLYNPNTELYSSSACVFEYFTTGGFFPIILFDTMKFDMYSGTIGIVSIVLQTIFLVFLIVYIGIIFKRIIQQKCTFLKVHSDYLCIKHFLDHSTSTCACQKLRIQKNLTMYNNLERVEYFWLHFGDCCGGYCRLPVGRSFQWNICGISRCCRTHALHECRTLRLVA